MTSITAMSGVGQFIICHHSQNCKWTSICKQTEYEVDYIEHVVDCVKHVADYVI